MDRDNLLRAIAHEMATSKTPTPPQIPPVPERLIHLGPYPMWTQAWKLGWIAGYQAREADELNQVNRREL